MLVLAAFGVLINAFHFLTADDLIIPIPTNESAWEGETQTYDGYGYETPECDFWDDNCQNDFDYYNNVTYST
jgi:hypothetical protein